MAEAFQQTGHAILSRFCGCGAVWFVPVWHRPVRFMFFDLFDLAQDRFANDDLFR
jgi:hypothetical protein